MIDPTELDELIKLLAKLYSVDEVKLDHPVSLYMEPEEAKTFHALNHCKVETVADFLLWSARYGSFHQFESKDLTSLSLSKILHQIQTL
jgi:hypothetical protein